MTRFAKKRVSRRVVLVLCWLLTYCEAIGGDRTDMYAFLLVGAALLLSSSFKASSCSAGGELVGVFKSQ